jgi:uncharacterized protein YjiS (DUF1127 family)
MRRTIFREAFDRMLAAREKQVRRYVNGQLLRLDDDALQAIGRTRDELRREGAKSFQY